MNFPKLHGVSFLHHIDGNNVDFECSFKGALD